MFFIYIVQEFSSKLACLWSAYRHIVQCYRILHQVAPVSQRCTVKMFVCLAVRNLEGTRVGWPVVHDNHTKLYENLSAGPDVSYVSTECALELHRSFIQNHVVCFHCSITRISVPNPFMRVHHRVCFHRRIRYLETRLGSLFGGCFIFVDFLQQLLKLTTDYVGGGQTIVACFNY